MRLGWCSHTPLGHPWRTQCSTATNDRRRSQETREVETCTGLRWLVAQRIALQGLGWSLIGCSWHGEIRALVHGVSDFDAVGVPMANAPMTTSQPMALRTRRPADFDARSRHCATHTWECLRLSPADGVRQLHGPGHDLRKRRPHPGAVPGAQHHPARIDGDPHPEPIPLHLCAVELSTGYRPPSCRSPVGGCTSLAETWRGRAK